MSGGVLSSIHLDLLPPTVPRYSSHSMGDAAAVAGWIVLDAPEFRRWRDAGTDALAAARVQADARNSIIGPAFLPSSLLSFP